MIKLKSPLNYRGTIVEAGKIIDFLPMEQQNQMVKNGVAEFVETAKTDLQEEEQSQQAEEVSDKPTKADKLEKPKKPTGDDHG